MLWTSTGQCLAGGSSRGRSSAGTGPGLPGDYEQKAGTEAEDSESRPMAEGRGGDAPLPTGVRGQPGALARFRSDGGARPAGRDGGRLGSRPEHARLGDRRGAAGPAGRRGRRRDRAFLRRGCPTNPRRSSLRGPSGSWSTSALSTASRSSSTSSSWPRLTLAAEPDLLGSEAAFRASYRGELLRLRYRGGVLAG